MSESTKREGLPGGVILPGVLFVASMSGFVVLFRNPGWLDFGRNISPAGICVLLAVVTLFWFLIAVGMRKPPQG